MFKIRMVIKEDREQKALGKEKDSLLSNSTQETQNLFSVVVYALVCVRLFLRKGVHLGWQIIINV